MINIIKKKYINLNNINLKKKQKKNLFFVNIIKDYIILFLFYKKKFKNFLKYVLLNKKIKIEFNLKKKNKINLFFINIWINYNIDTYKNAFKKVVKNKLINLKLFLNKIKKNVYNLKKKNYKLNKLKEFGVLRIDLRFTNMYLSLTQLTGQIISRYSSGQGPKKYKAKKDRMNFKVIQFILKKLIKKINKTEIKYIKIKFVGPSRKYRRKLLTFLRKLVKNNKQNKFIILCVEESYNKNFNGCRLSRQKR
jgi:ribosomal protein S11